MSTAPDTNAVMNMPEAVAVLRRERHEDDVVVSSMGSAREWMALGPLHERDFVLVPSAMGHATSLALGFALAQPERRIVVLSGDGSLMMNLGTLITIGAESPRNLVVVVFVNGVYEVTGAQPTPGASDARANRDAANVSTLAAASGIRSVFEWSTIDALQGGLDGALAATGPTLIVLHVAPVPGAVGPRSPGPTGPRAERFREALRAPLSGRGLK